MHGTVYMPDGRGGTMPAPAVLTAEEAVRFLRLHALDPETGREVLDGDPATMLGTLRNRGLRTIRAGRSSQTRRSPRRPAMPRAAVPSSGT